MIPRIIRSLALLLLFSSPLTFAQKEMPLKKANTMSKLEIKIPEISFNNTTLAEATEFLRLRSIELDTAIENKGLNIVLSQPRNVPGVEDRIIKQLSAKNLSILEAFNLVCLKTKTQYRIDEYAVVILPLPEINDAKDAEGEALVQRKWTTPENFLEYITPPAAGIDRIDTTVLLKTLGVPFPPNSTSAYLVKTNTLVVRNTPTNLHIVDAIVKASEDPEAALKDRRALEEIILPEIKLYNCTLDEAFGFLRLRSIQIDPAKKGVTLNLIGDEKLPDRIIKTLDLSNVPLTTALRYICSATETRAHFQGRNIIILSAQ